MMYYLLPVFLFGFCAFVIFLRPSFLLALLALAVPFSYMKNLQSGAIYYLPELIILAYIMVLTINYFGKREPTIVEVGCVVIRDRLFLIFLPFFTVLVLSAFPYNSLSFLKEVARWLEVVGVMIISRHVITEKKAITHILWSLAIAVGLEGLIVIIQVIGGKMYAERAPGTFENPNPLAAYLVLTIPVILGMCLHFKGRSKQIALVTILIISGTGFWLTFSRGAWGAASVAWLAMVLFANERKRLIAVSVGLASVITILIVSSHGVYGTMQLASRLQHTAGIEVRMALVRLGVGIAQDNFLLGIGAGNFKSFVKELPAKYAADTTIIGVEPLRNDLHNLYLQMLVETGILGCSSFLLWIGWALFRVLKVTQKMRGQPDYALQLGVVAGVAGFAIANMTGVFFVHGMGLVWGMLVGVGFVLPKLNGVERFSA